MQKGIFFRFLRPRLFYNFKTAHATAMKITQKKVLIISNLWVHFDVIRTSYCSIYWQNPYFPQGTHLPKNI